MLLSSDLRPAFTMATCGLLGILTLLASGFSQPLFGAAAAAGAERVIASVVSVEVDGEPGDYTFSVGVLSADEGCEQYADWWEIISLDGELIYRRTLGHSHVNEQPFVRSGGPVVLTANTEVWVRAHMFPTGYGGRSFRGSVEAGFQLSKPPLVFALDLAAQPPVPPACAF